MELPTSATLEMQFSATTSMARTRSDEMKEVNSLKYCFPRWPSQNLSAYGLESFAILKLEIVRPDY